MLALARWIARIPLKVLHWVGGWLGWLVYAASPSYRGHLRANAQRAGLNTAQIRQAVGEAGRMAMETPRLWLRPPDVPLGSLVRIEGQERLEAWLASPRGLLLLCPHLGCFEVAGQAYAERFGARKPMTVLFRPSRKAALRELEEAARAREHLATAPATTGGVRQLLRALKSGQCVGLLPDQVPPEGQGVWAPFFGRPAYTMTLAARLAQQTGAQVGVIWGERLPRGQGYVVHFEALPEPLPPPEAGELASASAINRCMEATIRACPAQYLWGYNRYKAPRATAPAVGTPGATA